MPAAPMAAAADHGVDAVVKRAGLGQPQGQHSKKRQQRSGQGERRRGGPDKPQAKGSTGLLARELAVDLIVAVLQERRPFDDALSRVLGEARYAALEPRDKGMARAISASTLRFALPLDALVAGFLDKPLPAKFGRVAAILVAGAAQLAVLRTPPHAAISLAVDQTRRIKNAGHLSGLVNAVLRKVATEVETSSGLLLETPAFAPASCFPPWLRARWERTYAGSAADIMRACIAEPPLDLTLKDSANVDDWAERLGARRLPTGSLRITTGGRIEELPGFADGQWWVQDAAAALPARLLGDIEGMDVADLCAAPGGKTAQLAAAGARVTAVDWSSERLSRLRENLRRLALQAELVEADVATWQPGRTFNRVLIDAPCSATGTIRRHPDIMHLKEEQDIAALAAIQEAVLDNAAGLVANDGMLVYCTCSLEPEEGEDQVAGFLQRHPEFRRQPVGAGEYGIEGAWLNADGDLRTLPFYMPDPDPEPGPGPRGPTGGGMDGFFAARLRRVT